MSAADRNQADGCRRRKGGNHQGKNLTDSFNLFGGERANRMKVKASALGLSSTLKKERSSCRSRTLAEGEDKLLSAHYPAREWAKKFKSNSS